MQQQHVLSGYPIDLEKNEIRVLQIYCGSWDSPIRCDIDVVSLDDRPVYSALSYVWGQDEEICEILIRGRKLQIKPNLYTALRRIRAHAGNQTRTLWVDAVCIDQANGKERTHQVGLMSVIYSKCSQCFVWLGEVVKGGIQRQLQCSFEQCYDLTVGSDAKFESLISHYDPRVRGINENRPQSSLPELAMHMAASLRVLKLGHHLPPSSCLPALNKGDVKAILHFFINNSWFSRLWVVQEAALPAEVVLLFGPVAFLLDDLPTVLEDYVHPHIADNCCLVNHLYRISERFYRLSQARHKLRMPFFQQSLLTWRLHLHGFSVTDHRDHIYGILALFDPAPRLGGRIRPEYSIAVPDLFTQVSREYLLEYESLKPFFASSTKMSYRNTPSWAIDFTGLTKSRETQFYLWTGLNKNFRASIGMELSRTFQDNIMLLNGLFLDRVSQCVRFKRGFEFCQDLSQELEGLYEAVRQRYVSNDVCSSYASWLDLPYPGDHLCTWQDAWCRTLCLDHCRQNGKDHVMTYERLAPESLEEMYNLQGHSFKCVSKTIRLTAESNSIFLTEKGYLGIAKDNGIFADAHNHRLSVGDSIFILEGGGMPFVLQKTETTPSLDATSEKRDWKVFGPCYVHGFMDGKQNEKLRKEQGGYTTVRLV